MDESLEPVVQEIIKILATYGLDVVAAIAILILGLLAAGWARTATAKALGRIDGFDVTLQSFLSSIVRYVVIAVTLLAVLSQFGVETTSLIAVLGAAGLAVGLALQGTLSSVAAGVMLLIFRPFKVGDFVEVGGKSGTVNALTLFVTELNTPDNVHIIIPNAGVWGEPLTNFSHNITRRVDIVLGIDYGDDINKAFAAIEDIIGKDDRIHQDPAHLIAVTELADSSVNLVIRVWCDGSNYWPLKFDLTKRLKERMDAEGISIPFPQTTVHMAQSSA
jgi:small conductance mechanosensitive channel